MARAERTRLIMARSNFVAGRAALALAFAMILLAGCGQGLRGTDAANQHTDPDNPNGLAQFGNGEAGGGTGAGAMGGM